MASLETPLLPGLSRVPVTSAAERGPRLLARFRLSRSPVRRSPNHSQACARSALVGRCFSKRNCGVLLRVSAGSFPPGSRLRLQLPRVGHSSSDLLQHGPEQDSRQLFLANTRAGGPSLDRASPSIQDGSSDRIQDKGEALSVQDPWSREDQAEKGIRESLAGDRGDDQPGPLTGKDRGRSRFLPWPTDPLRLLTMCRQFRYEKKTAAGLLVVQPMSVRHVDEVVDLLTDSFDDYFGIFSYRPLLRQQVAVYIAQRVMIFPRGITLVGRLLEDPLFEPRQSNTPTDPPEARGPCRLSSISQHCIVGVTELSFGPPGIPPFRTLNPPQGTSYIGNMAVRHEFRRKGVARALLEAAETMAGFTEVRDVHLHCRLVDDAPYGLYMAEGYETVAVDHRLAPFLTWERRRRLMRKVFPSRT